MSKYSATDYAFRGIRISTLIAGINVGMAFIFPIFFVAAQGKDSLGYYLTYSAVPSLIILIDRGKTGSASVLMSKLHTKKDYAQLFQVFHLLAKEITIASFLGVPILLALAFIIHEQTIETFLFILLICVSGLLSLVTSCLEAFYRGIGKFSEGIALFTLNRIFEFTGLLIGISLDASIVEIALLGIMGRFLGLALFIYNYLQNSRNMHKQLVSIDKSIIAEYKSGANANLAINLGMVFQNQIPLLIIEKILGIRMVAEYTILKTFSGLFKTLLNSVLSGTNSAFTISFERKANSEIKDLYSFLEKSLKLSSALSLPISFGIYAVWFRYQGYWPSPLEYALFTTYILGATLDGFFLKNLSIANSINRHGMLSRVFLLSNILSAIIMALLLPFLGLFSYPAAFLLLDLIMIPLARNFRARLIN